ncbi:hypothetical protein LOZ58_000886 [Ophidiomyces ophidiicola]|nr:hypothetical protein LOZ58_000886 [Ophidiomyces ophidiicola]
MSTVPSFRSSSSFSAGQTSNTAPVIKYRCLYTYDVKRKAKRWQDGFVSFHTFNRRLMTYGNAGDFVGDLHLREGDTIRDGDQLELERGILVDVGECLETSESDLTGLLDKRRPNPTSSAFQLLARPAAAGTGTGAGVGAPSKTKSLKELLGNNRTPTGRAALPKKSPFELCSENVDATRRQVTELPNKRRRVSAVRREPENRDPSALDSEQKADNHARQGAGSNRSSKVNNALLDESSLSFQPASALKISSSSRAERDRKGSKKSLPSNQKSIATMLHGQKAITAYPLSIENPRNKLMCLEPKRRPVERKQTIKNENINDADSSFDCPNENFPMKTRQKSDLPISQSGKRSALSSVSGNYSLDFVPSTSTMRVLEESICESDIPPSTQRTKPISDFFKPSQSQALVTPDEQDRIGPPERLKQISRSNSDSTSLTHSKSRDSTGVIPRQKECLQKSLSDTSSLRNRLNEPCRSIQTRLMTTNDDLPLDGGTEDEEQGPWTSEALDLFDWWPPGRPKPIA